MKKLILIFILLSFSLIILSKNKSQSSFKDTTIRELLKDTAKYKEIDSLLKLNLSKKEQKLFSDYFDSQRNDTGSDSTKLLNISINHAIKFQENVWKENSKKFNKFWDIPWNSNKQQVLKMLKSKKGNIRIDTEFDNDFIPVYIDEFSGHPTEAIYFNFENNFLHYISIDFKIDKYNFKSVFKTISDELIEKYGKHDQDYGSDTNERFEHRWNFNFDENKRISITLYRVEKELDDKPNVHLMYIYYNDIKKSLKKKSEF